MAKKYNTKSIKLGALLFLGITLPIIVWALISQNLNLKENAQSLSGIGQKNIKVMVIDFDPIMVNHGNQKLSVYKNWNNPQTLESQYSNKVHELSGNYVNYQIVERLDVNVFPYKNDGFIYTENTYINCLNNNSTCHSPDLANYLKILSDYQVCTKVNAGEIDELWIWGGPWFGYYEAQMAGPDSFNTNAPPLLGSTCTKNLHIMGFNYQRSLSEMLEDLGHRVEGTMTHVFTVKGINLWTKYTGHSDCGSVHIPPNGLTDYDWANSTKVSSTCEDYLNYPNLSGQTQTFGCERWGCTGLGWKEYWLSHLPKVDTHTNGTWDNWWKYVFDYSNAIINARVGDVNRDNVINIIDIGIIIDNYSQNTSAYPEADINNDGIINIIDIGIIIDNYGK